MYTACFYQSRHDTCSSYRMHHNPHRSLFQNGTSAYHLMHSDQSTSRQKTTVQKGLQKGLCEGRREELLRQTEAKLAKGKTNEQIADELELTMEETKELIKVFSDKQARRWKTS